MDGLNEVNGNEYIVIDGEVELRSVIGHNERCNVRGGDAFGSATNKNVGDDQSCGHYGYSERNEQDKEVEASVLTMLGSARTGMSAQYELCAVKACSFGRGDGSLERVPRSRQTECFRGGGGFRAWSFTFAHRLFDDAAIILWRKAGKSS